MTTLFYIGLECRVQQGTMINVQPPVGHGEQFDRYDIEKVLENMGLPHGEVQFAANTNYWETAAEHEKRMSNSPTQQSYTEPQNQGSGILAFAANGIKSGVKAGVNLVQEARENERMKVMQDMQAKKEYAEKHGREAAEKILELQEKKKKTRKRLFANCTCSFTGTAKVFVRRVCGRTINHNG